MNVNAIGAVRVPPVKTKVAKVTAKIIFGESHIENVDRDSAKYFFLTHFSYSYLLDYNLS